MSTQKPYTDVYSSLIANRPNSEAAQVLPRSGRQNQDGTLAIRLQSPHRPNVPHGSDFGQARTIISLPGAALGRGTNTLQVGAEAPGARSQQHNRVDTK